MNNQEERGKWGFQLETIDLIIHSYIHLKIQLILECVFIP